LALNNNDEKVKDKKMLKRKKELKNYYRKLIMNVKERVNTSNKN